jgi:hypothetical protein
VRRFRRVSGWNKAVHTTAANNGLGAKVSCVRCAREVSGLLLKASGCEYRCATPRRAQTLARNSSTRGGDADTHANANESADNSLRLPLHLFLLPFFSIHLHGRRPARDRDRRQRALPQRPCALLSTRRLHFESAPHRIQDIQIFDDASRGPLGALTLLMRLSPREAFSHRGGGAAWAL